MWLDEPFCHIQSWPVIFFPHSQFSQMVTSWISEFSSAASPLRPPLFAEACRSFLFLPPCSSRLCSSLLTGRWLVMSYYNQQETVQIGVLFFSVLKMNLQELSPESRHPSALESKSQWMRTKTSNKKNTSFHCKLALGYSVKMSSISIPPAKDNAYNHVYILLLFVFRFFFLDNGFSFYYANIFFSN